MTWWLQPGWTETRCSCGSKIWPEGDPDWGSCYPCFSAQIEQDREVNRYYEQLVAQQYEEELERQVEKN